MAKEAYEKQQEEMEKPKFRFDVYSANSILDDNLLEEIDSIQKKLAEYNFRVDIIEDLDCIDVTRESRYFIRIIHKNGVYVKIDLREYQDKIKDFLFDEQEYMENEVGKITGCINKKTTEAAEYIVDYLAHIMYFKNLYILQYSKIGWQYYAWDNISRWIFKYDVIYARNALFLRGMGTERAIEGLASVKDKDNVKKKEWVKHTIQLMNNHTFDCMIMGAGISGLVRQLLPYTKEANININIKGEPASGKSTICHYILGIFGNPEIIEGSFSDTDNAVEMKRAEKPVLPYILDDRLLKLESSSEKSKRLKVLMDVFREYEGKIKERAGKQYENSAGERTYGPVISSSVDSMMKYLTTSKDLGQYRRFMEFDIGSKDDKIVFYDNKEARDTETIAYKNYGIGIEIIINYMFELLYARDNETDIENASVFVEWFAKLEDIVTQELEEREEKERQKALDNGENFVVYGLKDLSKRFTLIIMSYAILRNSILKYEFDYYQQKYTRVSGGQLYFNDEYEDEKEEVYKKTGGLESLQNFDTFEEKQTILEDKSMDVLGLLIDNIVDTMKSRAPQDETGKMYKYVTKNAQDGYFKKTKSFTTSQLQELTDPQNNVIGYYQEIDNNEIVLYTWGNACLPQFFEMAVIPSCDVIMNFIKEVKEQELTPASANKIGMEKYKTIKIGTAKNADKYGRSNKTIKGEHVCFNKWSIKNEIDEVDEVDDNV